MTAVAGKSKKADTLNADLAKAGVYNKLEQKNVTAWLGLRNDAAHGHFQNYDASQVALLIQSVRDFLGRSGVGRARPDELTEAIIASSVAPEQVRRSLPEAPLASGETADSNFRNTHTVRTTYACVHDRSPRLHQQWYTLDTESLSERSVGKGDESRMKLVRTEVQFEGSPEEWAQAGLDALIGGPTAQNGATNGHVSHSDAVQESFKTRVSHEKLPYVEAILEEVTTSSASVETLLGGTARGGGARYIRIRRAGAAVGSFLYLHPKVAMLRIDGSAAERDEERSGAQRWASEPVPGAGLPERPRCCARDDRPRAPRVRQT